MDKPASELAFINLDNVSNNPFDLFKQWHEEAKSNHVNVWVMNLATASKCGDVSSRTVVMRDILEDGITFCAPGRGKKCKQINENPNVSTTFLWLYKTENESISRQVRMEGVAEKLPREQVCKYYKTQPFYGKIRDHICTQGEPVDWYDLKTKHDALLEKVLEDGFELETPSDYEGFKVVPRKMDFYYAKQNQIADRILFTKCDDGKWEFSRVCA